MCSWWTALFAVVRWDLDIGSHPSFTSRPWEVYYLSGINSQGTAYLFDEIWILISTTRPYSGDEGSISWFGFKISKPPLTQKWDKIWSSLTSFFTRKEYYVWIFARREQGSWEDVAEMNPPHLLDSFCRKDLKKSQVSPRGYLTDIWVRMPTKFASHDFVSLTSSRERLRSIRAQKDSLFCTFAHKSSARGLTRGPSFEE